MSRIPVVIVHIGDSYYLRDIVEINASKNPVIFVGCENNAYLGMIPNVKHMHYKTFEDSYVEFLKHHFYELEKGYETTILNEIHPEYKCTNPGTYQFLCFLRIYYVKKILEQENLSVVFHSDSDALLLESTNTLFQSIGNKLAYVIENNHNNIHMTASVHSSFLTIEFCTTFFNLYEDIYVNKSKRYLLKEKVEAISTGIAPGFICDMNFYYLLWREKIVELFDLTQPFIFDGEMSVFDLNIHNSSGYMGQLTYKMTRDALSGIKFLSFVNGKIYQEDINGRRTRLLSLHFNDCAKKRISMFRTQFFS